MSPPQAEAFAAAKFGRGSPKVREFVTGYFSLLQMGFPSDRVIEALIKTGNNVPSAVPLLCSS
jgi:hypothetical protein